METYILKENVLTDDVLMVASEGMHFKGGFKFIVKTHTFQNAWQDKETVKNFRSRNSLIKYLNKYYEELKDDPEFEAISDILCEI